MKRAFAEFAVFVVLLSHLQLLDAQTMPHEEEVVRNAYGKVSLLCALYIVTHAGGDQLTGKQFDEAAFNRQLADSAPFFTISDVQTGPILDIANDRLRDFTTVPHRGDRVLKGASTTTYFSDSGNQTEVEAAQIAWELAQGHDPESEDLMLDFSIADAIKVGSPQWSNVPVTYTRYASFIVDARLLGHTTGPHKAIFFFGKDAHGSEIVAFIDPISGMQTLWNAVSTKPYYPTSLLSSKLRSTPIVANWIRANQMSASSCDPTKRDLCCSRGVYGISVVDVSRDLSVPLPQPRIEGGNSEDSARVPSCLLPHAFACSGATRVLA